MKPRKLTLVRELPTGSSKPTARARKERVLSPPEPEAVERALERLAGHVPGSRRESDALRDQLALLHELAECRASYVVSDSDPHELRVLTSRGRADARIEAPQSSDDAVWRAYRENAVVREPGRLAVPLVDTEGPWGVVVLLSPKRLLTDSLARSFAAHISAAREVARLREAFTGRTKDLETAVAGLRALEQTREEVLAHVSHDLKNPLNTVKTYLTLLQGHSLGELNDRQAKAVSACDRNADRLLRMINDLLLMSRLQSGQMTLDAKPFGLKALAEEVVSFLSESSTRAGVRLVVGRSAEVFVRGDRDQLRVALLHLAENSLFRSPTGAEVELAVRAVDGQRAQLSITDTGAAIIDADLAHLFDAYHRPVPGDRSRAHTGGLGLPIAAKIVHLHGGRIEAASSTEGGARIQLSLPMYAGALGVSSENEALREGCILLVEDDLDCRDVLRQVLEMAGYAVVTAEDATQARRLLQEVHPALVLLDLRLSQEDGMSVLRHIRTTPALEQVAVYIVSGARDAASLSSGTGEARIDGFFEKPVQVAKLLSTVGAVVRPTGRL